MNLFEKYAVQLARGRRLRAYLRARDTVAAISDADLADMGLKRYQLGHVARAQALR